jgi:hypothetical protein
LLPHLTAIVQPDVVADAVGKKQTQSQDSVLGKKKTIGNESTDGTDSKKLLMWRVSNMANYNLPNLLEKMRFSIAILFCRTPKYT